PVDLLRRKRRLAEAPRDQIDAGLEVAREHRGVELDPVLRGAGRELRADRVHEPRDVLRRATFRALAQEVAGEAGEPGLSRRVDARAAVDEAGDRDDRHGGLVREDELKPVLELHALDGEAARGGCRRSRRGGRERKAGDREEQRWAADHQWIGPLGGRSMGAEASVGSATSTPVVRFLSTRYVFATRCTSSGFTLAIADRYSSIWRQPPAVSYVPRRSAR